MTLFRRKTWWERAVSPVTDHVDAAGLAKSGLTTLVGLVSLTAVSSAISAARRKDAQ